MKHLQMKCICPVTRVRYVVEYQLEYRWTGSSVGWRVMGNWGSVTHSGASNSTPCPTAMRMLGIECLRPTAHTVSYLTHSTTASHCCSCVRVQPFSFFALWSLLPSSSQSPPHTSTPWNREALLLGPPHHPFIFSSVCFPVCHLQQAVSSERVATLLREARPVLRKVCLQDQCVECPFYRWSGWGPEKSVCHSQVPRAKMWQEPELKPEPVSPFSTFHLSGRPQFHVAFIHLALIGRPYWSALAEQIMGQCWEGNPQATDQWWEPDMGETGSSGTPPSGEKI